MKWDLIKNQPRLFKPNFPRNVKKIKTDDIELFVIHNFMSENECNKLVKLIKSSLTPSLITTENEPDKYFRTSQTCYLSDLKNKFVNNIENRICRTIGIPSEFSEEIQGQHYEVGQEFKTHVDWFEPDSDEFDEHC
jgi:prolyl 4-hydroxylase